MAKAIPIRNRIYSNSTRINDHYRCDFRLRKGRFINDLEISLWKKGVDPAVTTYSKKFFRWEVIVGRNRAKTRNKALVGLQKIFDEVNADLDRWEIDGKRLHVYIR